MSPIGFWPFSNSWMLLWGMAAAAPILIHLWNRRKFEDVPWAAMEYLMAALQKHARRLRIEQLLLLVVRTAILLFLALAVAEPVAPWMNASDTSGARRKAVHTVIVLDASYSMDYRAKDITRFRAAKNLAARQVRSARQGDAFSLVRMSNAPSAIIEGPAYDPADVLSELEDLVRTDGGADLVPALSVIEGVVDRAERQDARIASQRVCFFSDMGRNTWEQVHSERAKAIIDRLAAKAELVIFDLGEPGAQNVGITKLEIADDLPAVGRPVRLDLEITDFGSQGGHQLEVGLFVDGQQIADRAVDLPAGDSTTVSLVHRFQLPGEHVIEARLVADRLPVDNRRWLSYPVRDRIQVLCVEGRSGAARYIALALDPLEEAQSRIHVVTAGEPVLLEDDLAPYDCLFLCNISRFSGEEQQVLERYVEQGGGVVFVLGDQVNPENYNLRLATAGSRETPLLPVRLGQPSPLGDFPLDPLDYSHEVVKPFRGNERAGLLNTPVWKYVPLELTPGRQATVALAMTNGDPLIVESSTAEGQVVVVATACSPLSVDREATPPAPWSAMATWPSFPPLVQGILRTAAGRRSGIRNVVVGESLRHAGGAAAVRSAITVTDPRKQSRRVTMTSGSSNVEWIYGETAYGGIYTARRKGDVTFEQQFAVNVDTRESQLDHVDIEALPHAFQAKTGAVANDVPTATRDESHLFRIFLAVVLGLLCFESLLAWSLGRRAGG